MVDSKTPDNVIPFPKKYRRPTTPEQDKAMQKKITQALCLISTGRTDNDLHTY